MGSTFGTCSSQSFNLNVLQAAASPWLSCLSPGTADPIWHDMGGCNNPVLLAEAGVGGTSALPPCGCIAVAAGAEQREPLLSKLVLLHARTLEEHPKFARNTPFPPSSSPLRALLKSEPLSPLPWPHVLGSHSHHSSGMDGALQAVISHGGCHRFAAVHAETSGSHKDNGRDVFLTFLMPCRASRGQGRGGQILLWPNMSCVMWNVVISHAAMAKLCGMEGSPLGCLPSCYNGSITALVCDPKCLVFRLAQACSCHDDLTHWLLSFVI